MISKITSHIKELESMKSYPKELFYKGNLELLKKRKVSIVGSRRPNSYCKKITHKIANDVIYNKKLNCIRTNLTEYFNLANSHL